MSNVQKYRKKPVVIEAMQFTDEGAALEILEWIGGDSYAANDETLRIPTLEGEMTAQYDDWIIRGVQGEFYPCKPNIFEATYEEVSDVLG